MSDPQSQATGSTSVADASALLAVTLCLVVAATVVAGVGTASATDMERGTAHDSQTNESTNETAVSTETVFREHRGDVVSIPVSTDEIGVATLTIEARSADYRAKLHLVDKSRDGRVTVDFNTFTAGHGTQSIDETFSTADGEDTIRVIERTGQTIERDTTPDSTPFQPTSFEVTARTSDGTVTNTSRIELDQPQAHSLTIWSSPRETDVRALDPPLSQSEDPVVRTNDRGVGDLLVVAVQATGLEGPIEFEGSPTAAVRGDWFELVIEETERSIGPQSAPTTLIPGPANTTVISDRANDTYIFVVDSRKDHPDTEYGDGMWWEGRDEFNATLSVGQGEAIERRFETIEPLTVATNDQSLAVVRLDRDQTVNGTTSLLPGTEFSVTIEAQNGTRWNTTTAVTENRTWAIDQSEFRRFDPGTLVEVDVRAGNRTQERGVETIVADGRPTRFRVNESVSNRTAIRLDSVRLSRGGYVVVTGKDCENPVVANSSFLPPRTTANVTLTLDDPVNNSTLVVGAYGDLDVDQSEDPTYDPEMQYYRDGEPITRELVFHPPPEQSRFVDENASENLPSDARAQVYSKPVDGHVRGVTTLEPGTAVHARLHFPNGTAEGATTTVGEDHSFTFKSVQLETDTNDSELTAHLYAEGQVLLADQKISPSAGRSDTIGAVNVNATHAVIESLTISENGFVAIVAEDSGEVLGYEYVNSGTSEHVTIPIDASEPNSTVRAVLFHDFGDDVELTEYDAAMPYYHDGSPVQRAASVPSQTATSTAISSGDGASTTSGDGPGFGVGAALLATLLILGISSRSR